MSTKFKFILSLGAFSLLQVGGMLMAPIIIISLGHHKKMNPAIVYGCFYLYIITVCSLLSSPVVIWSRISYRALFVIMFICVYCIIHKGNITLDFILKTLVYIVVAYGIVLFLQFGLYFALGIREFPLLNFSGSITMAGVFKPNGLAGEASHTARILTVLYWSILKLTEIRRKNTLTFRDSFRIYPLASILFWLSMLSMGSATAMIGILLVCLYFVKNNAIIIIIGLIVFILMMNVEIDNTQIRRLQNVFNSFFSDDVSDTLKKSEGSGSVRIMPLINTFNMDFFSVSSWIGQGSESETNTNFLKKVFSESRYVGDITSFGLLSYIASLLFVYKCCIRKFLTMESLIFLLLATFSVGSVYYTWLMLMIFMTVKYFEEHKTHIVKTESINTHEK